MIQAVITNIENIPHEVSFEIQIVDMSTEKVMYASYTNEFVKFQRVGAKWDLRWTECGNTNVCFMVDTLKMPKNLYDEQVVG